MYYTPLRKRDHARNIRQRVEDDRTMLSSLGVEEVVADGYGLVVTAQRRLGGEVDQNVWIRTSTGDEFLVKVSTDAGEGTLRWQETVLLRLERKACQRRPKTDPLLPIES